MSIFKKIWITFIKAVFCTCGEATFLLAKKECSELSARERLKLKLHLWKCKYCRWYIDEQRLLTHSIENLGTKVESNDFVYYLTPEQKQRIKSALEKLS